MGKRVVQGVRWWKGLVLCIGMLGGILVSGVGDRVQAQRLERVIIAYPSPSTSFLALIVADRRGFLREQGLEPDMQLMKSTPALAALRTGSVDYTTSYGSTVRAAMTGAAFRAVMVFAAKPMDFLVGSKEIKTVSDLKGKVIGVNAIGQTDHLLTVEVVRRLGMDPKRDVTITAVGDEGIRFAALQQGRIQGALLGSQGVVMGKKLGLPVLAAAADLIDLPLSGLGTTVKKLQEQPEQVKRVIRAGLQGLRFIRENREGTVQVIQEWFKLDREIAAPTYDLAIKSYSTDGTVSEAAIRLDMEMAQSAGQVKGDIPISQVVDFTLLKEILREGR